MLFVAMFKGNIHKFIKNLEYADDRAINIGVVKPSSHKQGARNVSNAQKLKWLDQGTSRSGKSWNIIGHTIEKTKIKRFVRVGMSDIVNGFPKNGLDRIGKAYFLTMHRGIRQTIKTPRLKQSTIDRKGHSKPLRDTDNLLKALGYEVE